MKLLQKISVGVLMAFSFLIVSYTVHAMGAQADPSKFLIEGIYGEQMSSLVGQKIGLYVHNLDNNNIYFFQKSMDPKYYVIPVKGVLTQNSNGQNISFTIPKKIVLKCVKKNSSCKPKTVFVKPGLYEITLVNSKKEKDTTSIKVVAKDVTEIPALPEYIGYWKSGDTPVWPPVPVIKSESFICNEGSTAGDVPTVTKLKNINLQPYCTSVYSEGAAGSYFSTYTYKKSDYTVSQNGPTTKTISFTLVTHHCSVYDNPKKNECEKSKRDFDVDQVADAIMSMK